MQRVFIPDYYIESYRDIDVEELRAHGIKGIIFDLDNTLIRWGNYAVSEELLSKINNLKALGFQIAIVSNNSGNRISEFAQVLRVPLVQSAKKPSRRPFMRALRLMKTERLETAMVGDQIFTDIVGGNRAGLLTILVMPVSDKEFIGTRFVRFFEKLVIQYLKRRGLIKDLRSE